MGQIIFFVMKFSKKKRKNNRPQQHIPSGDNLQNLLLSCFSPTTTSDLFRNLKIGYQVLSLKWDKLYSLVTDEYRLISTTVMTMLPNCRTVNFSSSYLTSVPKWIDFGKSQNAFIQDMPLDFGLSNLYGAMLGLSIEKISLTLLRHFRWLPNFTVWKVTSPK